MVLVLEIFLTGITITKLEQFRIRILALDKVDQEPIAKELNCLLKFLQLNSLNSLLFKEEVDPLRIYQKQEFQVVDLLKVMFAIMKVL